MIKIERMPDENNIKEILFVKEGSITTLSILENLQGDKSYWVTLPDQISKQDVEVSSDTFEEILDQLEDDNTSHWD